MKTCCFNCQTTDSISNPVETRLIEGKWIPLCDECMDEEERIDKEANRLAAMPSCAVRRTIIEKAESTRSMVNQLRAHDMSGCPACSSTSLPEVA